MPSTSLPGPVAVGGVGGSGTRVIASLMQALGFYIGGDLNKSVDNLWFTLLFKRPQWYLSVDGKARGQQVRRALSIFEKAMIHGLLERTEPWEADFINRAGIEISSYPQALGMGAGHQQVHSILHSRAPRKKSYTGWGWKEPNTHIFLSHICPYFPELKYIHVIRNGLDMAFGSNQKQLEIWGRLYGIAHPREPKDIPRAALHYWACANRVAVANARHLLGQRCHVILFDDLCAEPHRHISNLVGFLGGALRSDELGRLIALVQSPPTIGRYREHGLSDLDPVDIAAVRELGFDCGRG